MSALPNTRSFLWTLAVLLGALYILGVAVFVSIGAPIPRAVFGTVVLIAFPLALIASVFLFLWLFVLVHEFGQFFAGRAVGLKLRSIQVGPFAYEVTATGPTFRRVASWETTRGYCRMERGEGPVTIRQLKTHVLGGLIANLTLMVLLACPALAAGVRPLMEWSHVTIFQGFMWWITFLATVRVLAMPFQRTPYGDATQLRLLFNKEKSAVIANRLILDADLQAGKRGREWDLIVVDAVVKGAGNQRERLRANTYAYNAYVDRGDNESTMKHLHAAVIDCATPSGDENIRKLVLLEAAFAFARIENQITAAKEALAASDKIPGDPIPFARHRAEAAIALAEGDPVRAMAAAEEACQNLRETYPDIKPSVQAEIDWNKAITAEAIAALASQPTPLRNSDTPTP